MMAYLIVRLIPVEWEPGERPKAVDVVAVDGETMRYTPDRTCCRVYGRMKYGRRMPKCSECGQSLGDERWSYCPHCGALIEKE